MLTPIAIDLAGVELEIADAANKAGFDTLNHEALFDLIWAVKRVALKTGAGRLVPPSLPRVSIYPDRYRPRRRGNKSRKKSKAKPFRQPPNHDVEPKFHPVKPLMRKRPHRNVKEENVIDLTTASDTLSIPGRPTSPSIPHKRRKTFKSESVPKEGMQTASTNNQTTATYSIPTLTARESQAPHPTFGTTTPRPANEQYAPLAPETEITKQLNLVKTKLDDARTSMTSCQSAMKELFDLHCHRFDNDQMMASLQKLSNCMNKIYDGSKDGAGEIEAVVELLSDSKNI